MLTDVRYALRQIGEAQSRLETGRCGAMDALQRAVDALDRVEEAAEGLAAMADAENELAVRYDGLGGQERGE